MENYSKFLMLLLVGMVCVFSFVVLFKNEKMERAPSDRLAFDTSSKRHPRVVPKPKEKIDWKPAGREPASQGVTEPEIPKKPEKTRERYKKPEMQEVVKVVLDEIGQEIISDDLIISFESGTPIHEVQSLEKHYTIELASYDSAIGIAHFKALPGNSINLSSLKSQIINENPKVRSSEYNYVLKPTDYLETATLSKEFSSSQNNLWHLRNTGDTLPFSPPVPSVYDLDVSKGDLESTWNSNNPCALVAVVDTGFDFTHPEFSGRFWINPGESGDKKSNGIDDDDNGYIDDYVGWSSSYEDPNPSIPLIKQRSVSYASGEYDNILKAIKKLKDDTFSSPKTATADDSYKKLKSFHKDLTHGTGVFGLLAANSNDALAMGLCPAGRIMTVQNARMALDSDGNPQMVIDGLVAAKAIVYAADNKAAVINASFGQYWTNKEKNDCNKDGVGEVSTPCYILNAVEYAHARGSILISAAGNEAKDTDAMPHYPSVLSYERPDLNVISVGGHTPDGSLWLEKETKEVTDPNTQKKTTETTIIGGTNYGKNTVTLAAPSVYLHNLTISKKFEESQLPTGYTLDNLFGNLLTRNSSDSYPTNSYASGTSGATPLVSAGAAMVYQKLLTKFQSNQNKDFTKAVKDLLVGNARLLEDLSNDNIKAGKNGVSSSAIQSMTGKFSAKDGKAAILDIYTALNNINSVDINTLPASESMVRPELSLDMTCPSGYTLTSEGTCASNSSGEGHVLDIAGGGGGAGGGGCGMIDTGSGNQNSGNWPILVMYVVALILFIRSKFKCVLRDFCQSPEDRRAG